MATVLSSLLDRDGKRVAIGVGTIFTYNASDRCLKVLQQASGVPIYWGDCYDDKMLASFLTNDRAFLDLVLILGRVLGLDVIPGPKISYGPTFQLVKPQTSSVKPSVDPDLAQHTPETR